MQRFLALLMVLVLLAGMLMGCTPDEQLDTPSTPNTHPSSENPVPPTQPTTLPPTDPTDPTEPTDPPEPPEPPEQDFFTRHGQDIPAADQIPDYAQTTDTANLYTLPLELPASDTIRQIMTCGNTLYICYWLPFTEMPEGCGIRAYDLATGNTLYDVSCPDWSDFDPLDDGGLWFIEYETMTVYLYDAAGRFTSVCLETSTEDPTPYIYDTCVDPTGQYLLFLYDSGPPVVIHDLKTGAVTTPEFPDQTYFYTAQYQQGCFLLNDYDREIYLLDPRTGECEQGSAVINCDDIKDGIGYMTQEESIVLAGIDGDPTCYYLESEPNRWLSDLSHGCAVLNSYHYGTMVHVLDLRNERLLADISLPNCYTVFSLFLDNGSLLILAAGDDGNALYIYDTAAVPQDAEPLNSYQCTQEELEAETARIAQNVWDATGIELLYGSQGNDFVISDYVGVAELEPFKVFQAVNTVAKILDRYPDGMLREAWELTSDGLRIYLCGSLYGIYAGTLDTAGGVTTNMGRYIIVAMDINEPIDSVLPHELSHVFDQRISYMWEVQDWFAIWESIHPFSNPYIYSYDFYYEYTNYTPVDEDDPDDVWFVDSYGRTFPTEDRAKIMEVLWRSGEEPDYLLEYEHILAKAKLYCYILRQCFPSCNTGEGPFWEQFLGVIDESVLP